MKIFISPKLVAEMRKKIQLPCHQLRDDLLGNVTLYRFLEKAAGDETENRSGCILRTFNMMASFCRVLNLSLLLDSRFVVMTFSSSLAIFGYFAPFVFLPSHAQVSVISVDCVGL